MWLPSAPFPPLPARLFEDNARRPPCLRALLLLPRALRQFRLELCAFVHLALCPAIDRSEGGSYAQIFVLRFAFALFAGRLRPPLQRRTDGPTSEFPTSDHRSCVCPRNHRHSRDSATAAANSARRRRVRVVLLCGAFVGVSGLFRPAGGAARRCLGF